MVIVLNLSFQLKCFYRKSSDGFWIDSLVLRIEHTNKLFVITLYYTLDNEGIISV